MKSNTPIDAEIFKLKYKTEDYECIIKDKDKRIKELEGELERARFGCEDEGIFKCEECHEYSAKIINSAEGIQSNGVPAGLSTYECTRCKYIWSD